MYQTDWETSFVGKFLLLTGQRHGMKCWTVLTLKEWQIEGLVGQWLDGRKILMSTMSKAAMVCFLEIET